MSKLSTLKINLFLIVLSCYIASCASILNSSSQRIHIAASKNIGVSVDSGRLVNGSPEKAGVVTNTYDLVRRRQPLVIYLLVDSAEKSLSLKPRNSFAYWLNINTNFGLGMLLDRGSPKRYTYTAWNYLYAKDSLIYRRRFAPIPPGTLRFSLGLPLFNVLGIRSTDKRFNDAQYNTGVALGLGTGLDYFYKEDRYLSFSLGAAASIGPERKAISRIDTVRTGSVFYAGVRAGRVIGSFDIGYGVSLSRMELGHTLFRDSADSKTFSSANTALGLSFSVQYRIGNLCRIGLLYQPELWSLSFSPAFHYQQYISLGLVWKFPGQIRR